MHIIVFGGNFIHCTKPNREGIQKLEQKSKLINISAVILAGGEGTRLRPITYSIPKPLVPIAGVPAIVRIASLLGKHGIESAAVTTRYLSKKIKAVCGECCEGVLFKYFEEKIPLGTAGGVRSAYRGGNVLVISGDAVCDTNISAAVEFHIRKNADATLVLAKVKEPLEFGVVLCGKDGRIKRFIEKPAWQQAFSDTVNTGIYILSEKAVKMIPEGKMYDFGKDLFPRMLREGMALYGYEDSGYWCDVGDLNSFYSCNFRLAELEGSLCGGNAVGKNCIIPDSAVVRGSVLFDGVTVGEGCVIDRAILCEGVSVGNGSVIRRGTVIGAECIIDSNVSLPEEARVKNSEFIKKGSSIMNGIVFGNGKNVFSSDNGIGGDISEITPEYCLALGRAVSSACRRGRVGVLYGDSANAVLRAKAILCGLSAHGSDTLDLGVGFDALSAYAASRFGLAASICVTEDIPGEIKISLCDASGLYPERSFERALSAALADGSKDSGASVPGNTEKLCGLDVMYCAELTRSIGCRLDGLRVSLSDTPPARLLSRALKSAGASVVNSASDIHINIPLSGNEIVISENKGSFKYEADKWHIAAIIEKAELSAAGKSIALPCTAPECLEKLAADAGITVLKYSGCPADGSESEARRLASAQIWLNDACFAAMRICALIKKGECTVKELAAAIPRFYSTADSVSADDECKAAVIREIGALAEKQPFARGFDDIYSEGICIDYSNGRVRVIPSRRCGFRLIAESADQEIAEELMAISKAKLKKIIGKHSAN